MGDKGVRAWMSEVSEGDICGVKGVWDAKVMWREVKLSRSIGYVGW